MLVLADTGDDEAVAALEADAELVVWLARLMGDGGWLERGRRRPRRC
jgi:hypothetical protein